MLVPCKPIARICLALHSAFCSHILFPFFVHILWLLWLHISWEGYAVPILYTREKHQVSIKCWMQLVGCTPMQAFFRLLAFQTAIFFCVCLTKANTLNTLNRAGVTDDACIVVWVSLLYESHITTTCKMYIILWLNQSPKDPSSSSSSSSSNSHLLELLSAIFS